MHPLFTELFLLARAGNRDVQNELMTRLYPVIRGHIRSLVTGQNPDFDDQVQDVATAVIRCVSNERDYEFDSDTAFLGYVYTIASRTVARRACRRSPGGDPDPPGPRPHEHQVPSSRPQSTPHNPVRPDIESIPDRKSAEDWGADDADEYDTLVRPALELLAEHERELILAVYFAGQSQANFARQTEQNLSTVRGRLRQAILHLRTLIARKSPEAAARLFGAGPGP